MNGEAFARLNCKTQSFSDSGGGKVEFTVQDLAASMADCSPIQTWIIWRKFVNDKERGQAYMELWKECVYKIDEKGKMPKDKNNLLELFEIAVQDYIGGVICPKCEGRQELKVGNRVFKCQSVRCIDGKVKRNDADRARMMKTNRTTYLRQYKPCYTIISDYLTRVLPEAESSAKRIIDRKAR